MSQVKMQRKRWGAQHMASGVRDNGLRPQSKNIQGWRVSFGSRLDQEIQSVCNAKRVWRRKYPEGEDGEGILVGLLGEEPGWPIGVTNSRDEKFQNVVWGLLLLLNHFSCVRLCATPQTAAHQALLSLGFPRQEHWSGLPFPSPSDYFITYIL